MTSRLLAVTFYALDPDRLAQLWAALLGRDVIADADGVLLPGDGHQVGLRFCPTRAEKREPNRLHLHLTSGGSDQETVVASALDLGAHHIDVGQLPEEKHVVLGDPEGNELLTEQSAAGEDRGPVAARGYEDRLGRPTGRSAKAAGPPVVRAPGGR